MLLKNHVFRPTCQVRSYRNFLFWLLLIALLSVRANSQAQPAVENFYQHGRFDPQQVAEEELYNLVSSEYQDTTDPAKQARLATRLLQLQWRRLWQAAAELPAETVVVGDPLDSIFQPTGEWQWSQPFLSPVTAPHPDAPRPVRAHYAPSVNGVARHGVRGVYPSLVPPNGTLVQQIYFPHDTVPEAVMIRFETASLVRDPERTIATSVRWTKQPEHIPATENRPNNFWAGTLPQQQGGHLLEVNLCDVGLCGQYSMIQGIEYSVIGGEAWFGQTVLRRPQVEIRSAKNYHVFSLQDEMAFDLIVHNFSASNTPYTLDLNVSDYDGTLLRHSDYAFTIPAKSSAREKLVLTPRDARYFVFEASLCESDAPVFHGYSATAVIAPNRTGRQDASKFGMMYWDQPGREMVELYEQLGVKLIVIFPERERLHLFDPQKFAVMPMFWELPADNAQKAEKLAQAIQPYLAAGQRMFSNFWETDLRVPPNVFAPHMRRFYQIITQIAPEARVGIGGLAWFNIAYLNQLFQYAPDDAPFFDFLTAMLYNTPSPPEFSGIRQETSALSSILHAHNRSDAELWNVEWSYFDMLNLDGGFWLNRGLPRSLIAPYTIRHHLVGFASGIDRMVPGTCVRKCRTPLTKNYGHAMVGAAALRCDLTPLPLLPAYSVMTRMLEGKQYVRSLRQHPNLIGQLYRARDDRYTTLTSSPTVLVVWSLFGIEHIAIPLLPSDAQAETQVTLLNMVGDVTTQSTYNGNLHLAVSPEPTYVLLDSAPPDSLTSFRVDARDVLLTVEPSSVALGPELPATIRLTYHLTNPGWHAVHGALRLSTPNWLEVLDVKVHYPTERRAQLASQMLSGEQTAPREQAGQATAQIWLGRSHAVKVTYDVRIPEPIPRRTYYEQIALTGQPDFPINAVFESQGPVIARARSSVRWRAPLSLTMRPVVAEKTALHTPRLRIQLTNHSQQDRQGTVNVKLQGKLQAEPDQVAFTLAPGQTQTHIVQLKGKPVKAETYPLPSVDTRLQRRTQNVALTQGQRIYPGHYRQKDGYLVSHGVGEGFVVETLVYDQFGYETRQSRGFAFRPAVKAQTALTIDGDLHDWTGASPVFLDPQGRLSGLTFLAHDYGEPMQWTGNDDFSAAWQMMWDESFLYLAARTFDDQVMPQSRLGDFWDGDTLRFQIDPAPDKTKASPIPEPRDLLDIHTFECGLSTDGPVFRRMYPTHDQQAGPVESVRIAIEQAPDGLRYELAIPWDELAPLRPANDGGWLGLSLVFSEDDGSGRETRVNWFGGANGNGLARDPRLMGDVHFVR